jgi:hypothetical protein
MPSGSPDLVSRLLSGPDDAVLTPEELALLAAYLRQPVTLSVIYRERERLGRSPTQEARNKLTLIRDYNLGLARIAGSKPAAAEHPNPGSAGQGQPAVVPTGHDRPSLPALIGSYVTAYVNYRRDADAAFGAFHATRPCGADLQDPQLRLNLEAARDALVPALVSAGHTDVAIRVRRGASGSPDEVRGWWSDLSAELEVIARAPAAKGATDTTADGVTATNTPATSARRGIPKAEAEVLVAEYLTKHGKPDPWAVSISQIEAATGVPRSSINRLPVWKVFHAERKKRRAGKVRTVRLTDDMQAIIPDGATGRDEVLETLIREQEDDMAEEDNSHARRGRSRRS